MVASVRLFPISTNGRFPFRGAGAVFEKWSLISFSSDVELSKRPLSLEIME